MEVIELPDSIRVSNRDTRTIDKKYKIFRSYNEAEIHAALIAKIPAFYGGLLYQGYTLDPVETGDIWEATVSYGPFETAATRNDKPEATQNGSQNPSGGENGQESPVATGGFTFDVGGQSTHIIHSIKTVRKYPETAIDYNGLIGVNGDDVEGLDIESAQPMFTLTGEVPMSFCTVEWLRLFMFSYNYVNSEPFKSFKPGEVQFRGGTGQSQGRDKVQLTGRFALSENSDDVVVGNLKNNLKPVPKEGWDYLWVQHEPQKVNGRLIQVPVAMYIEQIFKRLDFKKLGF